MELNDKIFEIYTKIEKACSYFSVISFAVQERVEIGNENEMLCVIKNIIKYDGDNIMQLFADMGIDDIELMAVAVANLFQIYVKTKYF